MGTLYLHVYANMQAIGGLIKCELSSSQQKKHNLLTIWGYLLSMEKAMQIQSEHIIANKVCTHIENCLLLSIIGHMMLTFQARPVIH